jgi:hypothetical protein
MRFDRTGGKKSCDGFSNSNCRRCKTRLYKRYKRPQELQLRVRKFGHRSD